MSGQEITQIMRDNRSMRERLEYLTYELAEVHRMHQLAKEEIQKLRSIIAAETERGAAKTAEPKEDTSYWDMERDPRLD